MLPHNASFVGDEFYAVRIVDRLIEMARLFPVFCMTFNALLRNDFDDDVLVSFTRACCQGRPACISLPSNNARADQIKRRSNDDSRSQSSLQATRPAVVHQTDEISAGRLCATLTIRRVVDSDSLITSVLGQNGLASKFYSFSRSAAQQ